MSRREVLLITAVVVTLVAASSVALANDIDCKVGVPCVGTPEADTMTGTPEADTMKGLGGGDTMLGRGGDDTYAFGPDWGSDRIPADGEDADMGTDTLNFSLLVAPLDVDLVSSAARDEVYSVFSGAGTLNFPATVQIEDVKGGQARDVVRGNGVSNLFNGRAGNDSLYGRDGDDRHNGGLGADALVGGADNDVLKGGLGADTVYGDNPEVPTETGDDTIDVRDGEKDTVDCGPGTDTVFFDEGIDSVTNTCENRNPQ